MKHDLKIHYVSGKGYHNWAFYPATQLQEFGHSVTVLCPPEPDLLSRLKQLNLDTHIVEFPRRLHDWPTAVRAIRQLTRLHSTGRPDVVYHYMIPVSFWDRVAAYLARVPVRVYKPASTWEFDIPVYHLMEFLTAWMDTDILTSSRVLYDKYRSWRHTRQKTHLSYLGFPVARFDPTSGAKHAVRFRQMAGEGALLVGMIAYLYPPIPKFNPHIGIKGHEILIQAAKEVVHVNPTVKFVIVGDEPSGLHPGEYRQKLISMTRELGLSENFMFVGAQDDIPGVLEELDCVVMPSLSEGLPLASIEALLMLKPVVASRVGSLSEFVIDGETGFLVPPANAAALSQALIRLLALSPEQREAMGRKGREMVYELFDIRNVITRETHIYEQTLARTRQ